MPLRSDLPVGLFKYPWLLGVTAAVLLVVGVWATFRMRRLWVKHWPGRWWDNVEVERLVRKIARDPSDPDQAYARKTLRAYYLGAAAVLLLMAWHIWLGVGAR